MYGVRWEELTVAYDAHPQYLSSRFVQRLAARAKFPIQHHRAHIASVMAERGEFKREVLGVSFDGTGYGDDGTIWGGEIFSGSVAGGFQRVAHLRPAALPGGDAAAHFPVQAAAGFLEPVGEAVGLPDLLAPPFNFPWRYRVAAAIARKELRTFATTSVGRLFDAAAALVGFTREVTFEGQAAMWLENLAASTVPSEPYLFPFIDGELDYRPLLQAIVSDRIAGREPREIARAFQLGVAQGLAGAIGELCHGYSLGAVALGGGVFQNQLLLSDLKRLLDGTGIEVLINRIVPANDGGISLGQVALAAFRDARTTVSQAIVGRGAPRF
jgi:hydrogenase maturation protein HypF